MDSFALTDVGVKRDLNQDTVFAVDTSIGSLPNLFIVADGMGGENAGDYASKRAVEIVTDEVKNSKEKAPEKIFTQAIEIANRTLFKEAKEDPMKRGMGTTMVVATVIGDHLFVANVGDSRLYITVKDGLSQITYDHSVVAELVKNGNIKPEDAKTDRRRNMITRAVGAESKIKVDLFNVTLTGKEIILLCSDGLTNMVDDAGIYKIISDDNIARDKVQRLVKAANDNGGSDNISAIVIEPFNEVKKC